MYQQPYTTVETLLYSVATPYQETQQNISTLISQPHSFSPSSFYQNPHEKKESQEKKYSSHVHVEYHFDPLPFITQPSRFVDDAEPLQHYICSAFEKVTGHAFPQDMNITVCPSQKFDELHHNLTGKRTEAMLGSILGFSLNRRGFGISELFIRAGSLAQVMLTIGHEIGHVMSPPLINQRSEEAKAYAFSIAWIQTIREHHIAQLQDHFDVQPALNGVHNVAFAFVKNKLKEGNDPLGVFHSLVQQTCEV
ncbi:hypothetical protein J4410_03595 [Candidatus Woesearchaeota archaeon]|nr:hypothetical protein [Candidatus Woesearchaeota archaeon]